MGQKTHPAGFRLSYTKKWNSKWYEEKNYSKWLSEDLKIQKFIKEKLNAAGVASINIERTANRIKVYVHTARPGIVIGKKGQGLEDLKKGLQKIAGGEIVPYILEVRKAGVNAQLVSENIAQQIERRVSYRRAMKKAISTALNLGIKGIKVWVAGRLAGVEMARTEWRREGRVPLHTINADIEYGFVVAKTTYGAIGVKCWVYKGPLES